MIVLLILVCFALTSQLTVVHGVESRSYELQLLYPLHNTSTERVKTAIALPPDTVQQRAHLEEISPAPASMYIDQSGNLLAEYILEPASSITVAVTGTVTVSEKNQRHPHYEYDLFLSTTEHDYWQLPATTNRQLQTPLNIHQINDIAVRSITYDEATTSRKGAEQALLSGTGVCQEYSDVFVALARSSNIPARRHVGYGYTLADESRPLGLGPDILHVWPEYYDRTTSSWRFADPTWQNTTGGKDYLSDFDLDHITFAIQGIEDDYPYAAGTYGQATNTSHVSVIPTQHANREHFDADLSIIKSGFLNYFLHGKYIIEIQNKTGFAWYDISVENAGIGTVLFSENKFHLLPHQTKKIELLPYSNSFVKKRLPLHIKLASEYNTRNYELGYIQYERSIWKQHSKPIAVAAVLAGCAIITGSLLVSRRKRHSSIRW